MTLVARTLCRVLGHRYDTERKHFPSSSPAFIDWPRCQRCREWA